ncbi:thiol-disulfide isomerase/thioredoxin [Bacillus ectoiniformans]|uniref:thioredoxin domain-containing protein n=1 Tax=Bacillus ectoiniformans TaxID=1494429 RepID=UPI00195E3929|nr:thiol-disulfide isomerase/thioredoxin [Bacillus ectoiniformans]
MKPIHDLADIQAEIESSQSVLLYISREQCSVCHALLPQVKELLTNYPSINAIHASADDIPEIAGEFSIFTVPVLIFFVDGKEMFRKARFVPMNELDEQLGKIMRHL